MKLGFRTVFWAGAVVLVLVFLVWAFRPRPLLVDTAQAQRGEMTVMVRDEGRARVRDVYVLSAPLAGRLLRVQPEAGDAVQAGDPVARLLPPASAFLDPRTEDEAAAAVAAAEASLAAARNRAAQAEADRDLAAAEESRAAELTERGVAPAARLDRARRDLRAARAALAAAQAEIQAQQAQLAAARARLAGPRAAGETAPAAEIAAPVSGRVLRVRQESESVVAAGAPILEIGDPQDLEVVVELLSSDAARVERGADALIENWGGAPDPLPASVRRVEPSGFTKISALGVEEQRVNVILDLDDPAAAAEAGLGDGWRVDAAIVTWRENDVLQVPVAALFRDQGEWAVFRIEDGRARLQTVEIGQDNGDVAQVLAGLTAGTPLVLYPGERIADGARVQPRDDG